jgi:hypothetical protein
MATQWLLLALQTRKAERFSTTEIEVARRTPNAYPQVSNPTELSADGLGPLRALGKLFMSSIDGPNPGLDYALVAVEDSDDPAQNVLLFWPY